MASLTELNEKRAALDAQIAEAKDQAIADLREQMRALGITPADLGALKSRAPVSVRPPKFRDAEGNTWTGVGKRPAWLRKALLAGATLEQFKVE